MWTPVTEGSEKCFHIAITLEIHPTRTYRPLIVTKVIQNMK